MKSNNNHEAITKHLAMPERQIPVLVDSDLEKAEGFVPSRAWNGTPLTRVRRLLPSFVEGLESLWKRKEIENEHGVIDAAEWGRLRALLALKDRINAGDLSPVISSNAEEMLGHFSRLLDEYSPEGWFAEPDKTGTNRLAFKAVSGKGKVQIDFQRPSLKPLVYAQTASKAKASASPVAGHKENKKNLTVEISAEVKSAEFALSEAFTNGLSKTRFVVWWSEIAKRLVPGLYCPDIVTALYALAMWNSGTAGGWAICRKCGKDYPRSRAKQLYCSHKCQVAAGMRRYRKKLEGKAGAKSKAIAKSEITTKGKKRAGRK